MIEGPTSDVERMAAVNAQLAKVDAKAIGIAQVAGVMLADMLKQHAAISTARRNEIAAERVRLIKEAVRVAGSEDGPDTPFTSPWLNAMLGV